MDAQHAELSLWREGGEAQPISLKWSAMGQLDRDEHVRSWDAGNVRTGAWGASVRPVLYRRLIHADGPGETQVDIRVPDLVTVKVEVTDAETGAALEPERLMWSDSKIEGLSQSFSCPLQPAGAKGAYQFEAPTGIVNVSCTLNGYSPCHEALDLNGNERSLHIKLLRACGVHVEVFEGEARLRGGFEFFEGVRCFAASERHPVGRPAGGTEFDCTRHFDAPGQYTIKFPVLAGYEPIEPVTVDVIAGQIVEVPVHVKRNH
jgi:hypothetical protein